LRYDIYYHGLLTARPVCRIYKKRSPAVVKKGRPCAGVRRPANVNGGQFSTPVWKKGKVGNGDIIS